MCKAIPVSLIQLIQNILKYFNIKSVLPKLAINDCELNEKKFNNTCISAALKSKLCHNYNRGLYVQVLDMKPTMEKAHLKCIKWPIAPQVKENFKIIHKIYPVAEFLKRRFKFVVDPCTFCNMAEET